MKIFNKNNDNNNNNVAFHFLHSTVGFFISCIFCDFVETFGRLLFEKHFSFRDLVIRPLGLQQVPVLLNDNSLLKTFFQRSIIWLYTIIISLYYCYVVTFCMWSLYFVYEKNNQPTKQITTNNYWSCRFSEISKIFNWPFRFWRI